MRIHRRCCLQFPHYVINSTHPCRLPRCGVCSQILPPFCRFSNEFKNLTFIYAHVDECPETTQNIRYTPTFHFYRDGERVDEMFGAGEERLRDRLWLHSWLPGFGLQWCCFHVLSYALYLGFMLSWKVLFDVERKGNVKLISVLLVSLPGRSHYFSWCTRKAFYTVIEPWL